MGFLYRRSTAAALAALLMLAGAPRTAQTATLVLEGEINETMEVGQERVFTVPRDGLKKLVFRYANPVPFKSATMVQTLSGRDVAYQPRPESVVNETDRFGNTYTVVTWKDIASDAVVRERYRVDLSITLKDAKSSAPFPLNPNSIPAGEKVFLERTSQVETDERQIKELSARLTAGAATEQAAVVSVLNWVVDNIRYKTPIPEYGALWTLGTGYGNCQNYSHLSIALLRAAGIPARIVGGVTIGKSWKVPIEGGALMQSIGQGGHAWMEVWYPDMGWVSYDPQQSHLFVSPRHIKQTVGLDSIDINDSWRASPALPPFREDISAEFSKDSIEITLKESVKSPKNYIMTTSLAPLAALVPPPPLPPTIAPPEEPHGVPVEFGNMDFPDLADLFVSIKADVGRKTFDKETAEYVTGAETFSQAFTVKRPLSVATVSLAMHKFGGRLGSLWIDIVHDSNGRPGNDGIRSMPLSLDTVAYSPGYKWFDFTFSRSEEDRPVLKPGRYWIILRRSKDAVVNWFYTPGNSYGTSDDARSTAGALDWPNVLNYDFNFKVRGVYLQK